MQRDDDARPFAPPPARYRSSDLAVWLDVMFMRPVARVLSVDVTGPAQNVNALDEVPDSSWFTNRWPTPDETREGPCRGAPITDPAPGALWFVTAPKRDGITPGFFARDAAGQRYLVKFDLGAEDLPEVSTAADATGARLYWAAGFNTPCTSVVFLDPAQLRVAPEAARAREPFTAADLDELLAHFPRRPDGRVRATASRILAGTVLGPWRYTDTRADDPNDVIAHEERRDVRGSRTLAAWLNHRDAREGNTLDVFVRDGGAGPAAGHVQHFFIDFGDGLGMPDAEGRRQFDLAHFDPERWGTDQPNPAFQQAQEADRAWMARVLTRLTPAHLRAALEAGRFSSAATADLLAATLEGRWRAVLQRYLRGGHALGEPRVDDGARLCAVDLARRAGMLPPSAPAGGYAARGISPLRVNLVAAPGQGWRVCADLRALPRAPDAGVADAARYRVVELTGRDVVGAPAALRAHLYDLGPARGFALVGVER